MRLFLSGLLGALLLTSGLCVADSLISIDVHDADISDVITLLAAQSGQNIITDDSIKAGRITLHLRDVTFDRALSVLVSANGLQVHRVGMS